MADHTLCVSSKVPYTNRKETHRPAPAKAESPAVIRDANGVPEEWTLLTAYPFFERINGVF